MNSAPQASDCAREILEGFHRYNADFRSITQRARWRFEHRDWIGGQRDTVERIELYEKAVQAAVQTIRHELGDRHKDRGLWIDIRDQYAHIIEAYVDSEFMRTFFSSVTRRIFGTVGVDSEVEFIAVDVEPTTRITKPVPRFVYFNRGSTRYLFDEVLADFAFVAPYRDVERSIDHLADEVQDYQAAQRLAGPIERVELLKPVFYQGTRAYLVGRITGADFTSPLVIALKSSDSGIVVDAVILSVAEVSILFGFTRSYYHVDLETVGDAVAFLKSLLPAKRTSEIYTVLGRSKQGKTERYRSLMRHLESAPDQFIAAPGDKGLVMVVFTLPSYDVVFKVIRDRFAYPKTMLPQDVINKYQLVFRHDRAGRLVDAQEFRQLAFERSRFSPGLLDELLSATAETTRAEGDRVVVSHVYIERRLTPLNLYLREAEPDAARLAVLDYGQAIRDLAMSNIFAGDLLLKNFGVTRHGRVIFYDYDELCLVTDCNFRDLPAAQNPEDEMRAEAWYYVADSDVFPEQFISFLGFPSALKQEFLRYHSEILTADYWRHVKARHLNGEVPEVLPYNRQFR
ncbi:MAG: bifunctional isocitrate dehydrogenase kinase/phosphatase [Gammaproteobacteria bacterium]|nr:bifunctional isocitrate dehydrogenase kinase/phosphatase [Gammaproteobacteria bacterium]